MISLKAHMLTHQAEKPSFPCSYCPSVMARKSDLRYHISKQHARQAEPLACNKCDEDFPDKYVQLKSIVYHYIFSHFRYTLRMHGKTHKGQTIYSCTDCEFSANTNQQLDDHMNKHRGTRPFQCSECGLMFAARADLRAHVTRTHKNSSTAIQTTPAVPSRRPQRRAASLQHRFIGNNSTIDDLDEQQNEDEYRCSICQRQFTSARLLDRHTYAVHESYNERNYPTHAEEEDDIHDYADDELAERERPKTTVKNENNYQDEEEEEEDLAAHVEDIAEGDEEMDLAPTIKSVSSANKKVKKINQQEALPNKRSRRM